MTVLALYQDLNTKIGILKTIVCLSTTSSLSEPYADALKRTGLRHKELQ